MAQSIQTSKFGTLDTSGRVPVSLTGVGGDPALGLGLSFNVGGKEIVDVKFYVDGPLVAKSYDINNKDSEYLSSTDTSFEMLHKTILNELFQSKSIYEN